MPETFGAPKIWEIRSQMQTAELGLLLQMSRSNDRYLSTILLLESGREPVPLLASCEGDPS